MSAAQLCEDSPPTRSEQPAYSNEHMRTREISLILEQERVTPVFQPIVDLASGDIFGYEGLIRGPAGSPLHSPGELFQAASRCGSLTDLEWLCCRKVLTRFMQLGLPQRLFVNISPQTVALAAVEGRDLLQSIGLAGNGRDRVVIELTEHTQARDLVSFHRAMSLIRALGFGVALDDLGEGFSSLRLWSELNPGFVKIDMHFVQGVHLSALKFQFLKSLQQIAENCGSSLVAEGIESVADLNVLRDLGIRLGQGYLFQKPLERPLATISDAARQAFGTRQISVYPEVTSLVGRAVTAERLLLDVEPMPPQATNQEVFERFEADPELGALPVVRDGIPKGLISRHKFIGQYARPYYKELYGRRSCTTLMDHQPLIVEKDISLHELSQTLTGVEPRYLGEGFVITHYGRYAGFGSAQDLIRAITRLQVEAARYANPLTLLPGNVPIDGHMTRLLDAGQPFTACYADLNHFKSFNDAYGYRRGDEMIKLTATLLANACDTGRDFLGHIGGDDFIVLFQSEDWEARCTRALQTFDRDALALFDREDVARNGIGGEDRLGNPQLFPLTSLALGVIRILPADFPSHLEVAAAAAEAKKQAKRIGGSALFIERRHPAASKPS